MANKTSKHRNIENKPAAIAAAQRAFSGAWGTHNSKSTKRANTRLAANTKAIRDFA